MPNQQHTMNGGSTYMLHEVSAYQWGNKWPVGSHERAANLVHGHAECFAWNLPLCYRAAFCTYQPRGNWRLHHVPAQRKNPRLAAQVGAPFAIAAVIAIYALFVSL